MDRFIKIEILKAIIHVNEYRFVGRFCPPTYYSLLPKVKVSLVCYIYIALIFGIQFD